jgi:hypothetical protein
LFNIFAPKERDGAGWGVRNVTTKIVMKCHLVSRSQGGVIDEYGAMVE